MSLNFCKLLAFAFLSLAFSTSWAIQRHTISQIEIFQKEVQKKAAKIGAENMLVVYDFDNTLMAMDQDIGSDQWFNWQAKLLKDPTTKNLVAKDIDQLLHWQLIIFSMGKMHPVESITAKTVQELQKKQIKSIILTSRGPRFRVDTEIELQSIGLSFEQGSIGPAKGYPGTFLAIANNNEREVSYQNGIAMGSGLHKGHFLKLLLQKTGSEFKAIYFLDDTLKNIENMEAAFDPSFDLQTFHYTFEESRVKAFEKNQTKAIEEWNQLAPVLKNVFKNN